ncbi:unnamed protein product [Boreogadus saida]
MFQLHAVGPSPSPGLHQLPLNQLPGLSPLPLNQLPWSSPAHLVFTTHLVFNQLTWSSPSHLVFTSSPGLHQLTWSSPAPCLPSSLSSPAPQVFIHQPHLVFTKLPGHQLTWSGAHHSLKKL